MKSKRLVPIRDRRQRKRILTLKNFGIAAGVSVVVFAGISIYSEIGRKGTEGDYGRLLGRQIQPAEPKQPNLEVVLEAPIVDETAADPMLLAPAAREQYLGTYDQTIAALVPVTSASTAGPQDFVKPTPILGQNGERLTVVGDSNGVGLVVEKQERPALSGGIFKK